MRDCSYCKKKYTAVNMNRARSAFWKRRVVVKVERWEFVCFSTHCVKNVDFLDVKASAT